VCITCSTHSSGQTKTSAEPKRLVHERLFLGGGASTSGPECPFSFTPANSACFSASSSSGAGAGLQESISTNQHKPCGNQARLGCRSIEHLLSLEDNHTKRRVLLCMQPTDLPEDIRHRRCSSQCQLHTRQYGAYFGAWQSWRWTCCLASMHCSQCNVQAAGINRRCKHGLHPPSQHQAMLPAQPRRHLTRSGVTSSQ
jgi:hypothetical protein